MRQIYIQLTQLCDMVGGLSIHDRSVTDAVLLSTDIHQHHPSLRYLKKNHNRLFVFLSSTFTTIRHNRPH